MKLILISILSIFTFLYAECEEITTQAECEINSECEWHADDNACEDAEGHDHSEECGDFDHLDIDGLILESNGVEVYRQFQGLIEGSLDLHVNESQDFSVHFLDDNGNEVTVEHPECFPLSFDVSDLSVISIESENHNDGEGHDHDEEHCDELGQTECESSDHCEWHADDNACEDTDEHEESNLNFEITALSQGSTTFSVSVMHDGHADYTSLPILVTVEEDHSCIAGDVNSDGDVNVIDIVLSVDVILGVFIPEDICAYDFNSDGLINVVDVVQIVQYIITPTLASINEAKYIEIIQENELLSISSDGFVQGLSLIHI